MLGAALYALFYPVIYVVCSITRTWPRKSLKGWKVIITGGASGIGKLMTERLLKEGAEVTVIDINVDNAPKHTNCKAIVMDVTDKDKWYNLAKENPNVDMIIMNAGIVQGKPFLTSSDQMSVKVMDVNVMSHMWAVRAFLPGMKQRNKGHLVTIASAASRSSVSGLADYCASKAAAASFMECIRLELRKEKSAVRTTIVNPYYIDTGMFAGVKTRFPLLLPILRPEYVSNRIIDSVMENWEELQMPWIVNTVPVFRLLPVGLMDWVADFLGVSKSMDEFKGRQAKLE